MDNKDKIRDMLGKGIPAANVADAIGVTASYISQLMADPNFAMEVATIRTKDLTLAHEIDEKYDDFEKRLLERLETILPLLVKPRDIIEAIRMMNAAKRKVPINTNPVSANAGKTVTINMPVTLVHNYKINMQGGIVEVEDRSLRPMPSADLLKMLNDRNKVIDVKILENKPLEEVGGQNGQEPELSKEITSRPRKAPREISVDSV